MLFRQHLDTAPIWEAFRTDCECPLCLLKAGSEQGYVENFLGGSVMEPEMRVEVNEKGFCRRHLDMLYNANNRLGLALMADTHMQEVIKHLKGADPSRAQGGKMRFGGKGAPQEKKKSDTCILCDRLETAMGRYEETLLVMWKTEEEFRKAFSQGKGVCLAHYERLCALAPKKLSGKHLSQFLTDLHQTTLANFERVQGELNWFTLKFDYRNRDKPWGNSRDSVERALIKLRGGVAARTEEKSQG